MEIQPNQKAGGINPAVVQRTGVRREEPPREEVSFAGSTAVRRALEEAPDVRVEMIQRARNLVGDPTYPPRETIQRLSHLLAMRLPVEG